MALIAIQFESNKELLAFHAGVEFIMPDVVVEVVAENEIIFRLPDEEDNVTYKYNIGGLFFEAVGVEI